MRMQNGDGIKQSRKKEKKKKQKLDLTKRTRSYLKNNFICQIDMGRKTKTKKKTKNYSPVPKETD